jgi:branched-chain amino acid transport system substrate-binding protein
VRLAFKEINEAGGILGRRVEVLGFDIQTDPAVAKAAIERARVMDAYAVMGPVFSSSVAAVDKEVSKAAIPTFIGGDASSLTETGNAYLFRSSLSQKKAMPKLALYLKEGLRAQSVAMVTVDNEFGRGGRAAMTEALQAQGIRLVADLTTAPDQADFTEVVAKVIESRADAAFVYLNEDEAALSLQELHRQGYGGWIVGETTLVAQSVIDRAPEASIGVRGHTGLTPDALVPAIRDFSNRFLADYGYKSDHNGMKGYIAAYVLKAVSEKVGKPDKAAIATAMKGLVLSAGEHPGILLDVAYDDKGDLDRASFIVQVGSGRQHQFIAMLPATGGDF